METSKDQELARRIRYLTQKRKEHEALINQLVGDSREVPHLSTASSSRVRESRASHISHQVNFLTHLDSSDREEMVFETVDRLSISLQGLFGKTKMTISPGSACKTGFLYSENTVDF